MSNTTQKQTSNIDNRLAQAITDTPRNIIVGDICNSADKLSKRLGATAIASDSSTPCNFTMDAACAAVADSFDYDAHIAEHDSRMAEVVTGSGYFPDNWEEVYPHEV